MIFAQDVQLNNIQSPVEIIEVQKISYNEQNSAVINYNDSPSAIYKQELKKPKIITPHTTTISPLAKMYAEKLKSGTANERNYIMDYINFTCSQNPKEGLVFSDSDITNGLFTIINEDTSKLSKPSKRKLKLRKEFNEGKKLSQKQVEFALSYSDSEFAEQNKILAFYTLATIQNLSDKVIIKKTGLCPKLHDSAVIDKIIYEAQNNNNANMRAAALGALHMISKPEYNKDLKPMFKKALSDNSKAVRDMAQEALQYME